MPFFPVTDWADGKNTDLADKVMSWAQMSELVAEGCRDRKPLSPVTPDFGQLDPEQVGGRTRRVARSDGGLDGDRAGHVRDFLLGQSMNWTAAAGVAAREAGYEIVYAQAEATRPAGTVPRTFVTKFDSERIFRAALQGKYDRWEEWFWMSQQRLVSVIVGTRNRPDTLREALASIRALEGPDLAFEILVGDNGTTPEMLDVVAEFGGIHDKTDVYGCPAARNLALRRATGEFVAFLDDDDVWLPGNIRPHIAMLDAHPEYEAVFRTGHPGQSRSRPGLPTPIPTTDRRATTGSSS